VVEHFQGGPDSKGMVNKNAALLVFKVPMDVGTDGC